MLSIVITLIGIAAVAIFSYQVYSNARENGRNAGLLVLINLLVGLGSQWVIPFFVMVAIVVVWVATGGSLETIDSQLGFLPLVISVGGLIISFAGMMQVLKYASAIRDDEPISAADPPPPPPVFGV